MGVTLKNLEQEIAMKRSMIQKMNLEVSKLENQKKKLLDYEEKNSVEKRTLRKYIARDTKTVDLMDEFERLTEEGFQKYVRLIDTGIYQYTKDKGFQFIIERLGGREYQGDISMTDYKNVYRKSLCDKARQTIRKYLVENPNSKNGSIEILFDKPYRLRAQNSKNRSGYGNIYDGSELIHKGTLYGETTSYAFVGVVYVNR